MIPLMLLFLIHKISAITFYGVSSTIGGLSPYSDGTGYYSRYSTPRGVAISPDQCYALISDSDIHLIRKIILSTEETITIAGTFRVSGSTNAIGTNATFNQPQGIAISPDGSYALVADTSNNMIRKILMSNYEVTTFAEGFYKPYGVSISPDGSFAIITDTGNQIVVKIYLFEPTGQPTGLPTTIPTGDPTGQPTELPTGQPTGDPTGQPTFTPTSTPSPDPTFTPSPDPTLSPTVNPTVTPSTSPTFTPTVTPSVSPTISPSTSPTYKPTVVPSALPSTSPTLTPTINPTSTLAQYSYDFVVSTTIAGVFGTYGTSNGIGTNANFNYPCEFAISANGTYALIADAENHLIRMLILSTAAVITLAGLAVGGEMNGVGTNTKFLRPRGVVLSKDNTYSLIGDSNNNLIRKIIMSTATVTTFAGSSQGSSNGVGTNAQFYIPNAVDLSPDNKFILVADTSNHMIRHIVVSTQSVTTLAGQSTSGSTNGIGTNAKFNYPNNLAVSKDGLFALVGDYANHLIRKIIISTAAVTTLAGVALTTGSQDGVGTNARFNNPFGITFSPSGLFALISDQNNHIIRKIVISTLSVTTIAGVPGVAGHNDGAGTSITFTTPTGVTIAPDGSFALVADYSKHDIRMIVPFVPTLAPTNKPALRRF